MKKVLILMPLMVFFYASLLQAQCSDSLINKPIFFPLKCYGDSNALFGVSLTTKAIEPVTYTYKKEGMDNVFSKDIFISHLKAGKYSCTVTDARGCRDSIKVEITQPKQMSVDLQTVQCDDGTGNGKIKGIVRVGDSIYPYRWESLN